MTKLNKLIVKAFKQDLLAQEMAFAQVLEDYSFDKTRNVFGVSASDRNYKGLKKTAVESVRMPLVEAIDTYLGRNESITKHQVSNTLADVLNNLIGFKRKKVYYPYFVEEPMLKKSSDWSILPLLVDCGIEVEPIKDYYSARGDIRPKGFLHHDLVFYRPQPLVEGGEDEVAQLDPDADMVLNVRGVEYTMPRYVYEDFEETYSEELACKYVNIDYLTSRLETHSNKLRPLAAGNGINVSVDIKDSAGLLTVTFMDTEIEEIAFEKK